MSVSDYTEYILRFSYGKDSFKALDVICTRGLPLDRITTTDVWATDTVPAWLPPMQEFKDRMDEWIWDKYRLHVEHLCARNKDGSKRTYEQMFYHVPVRRSQSVQVERERERPSGRNPGVSSAGNDYRIPTQHEIQLVPETQDLWMGRSRDSRCQRESPTAKNSKFVGQAIKGFPLSRKGNGVKWCQDLKTQAKPYFLKSAPRGAEKQISWSIWVLRQMSLIGTDNWMQRNGRR